MTHVPKKQDLRLHLVIRFLYIIVYEFIVFCFWNIVVIERERWDGYAEREERREREIMRESERQSRATWHTCVQRNMESRLG